MEEIEEYTIHEVKLRYGEGGYGEFPYKNEWGYVKILKKIKIEDDVEEWLIDQYKEDYLNG